jgi:(p)ppGpp synthase/HD superfamily hydrolase
MKYLDKMLLLATTKFAGKFDKAGKPYILHCLAVMHKLRTDDEELMCIALGHDLVEDTDVTYTELSAIFSHRIVEGIRAMTKHTGQTYDEYKAQVVANFDAVRVKMADLQHNSDLRRLKGITAKDVERTAKYMCFYQELKDLNV